MSRPILEPTYYVRHPDDSYSVAQPQPSLCAAPNSGAVPREPTPEMLRIGWNAALARTNGSNHLMGEAITHIWQSMYDVALDAPTAARGDAEDAARYRWLVETDNGDVYMEHQPGDKAKLDAAIDAARGKA